VQTLYGARAGDSYEPNNTSGTASVLAFNGSNQIDIRADILSNSDGDWYKVTTPSNSTSTVTVKMQSAGLSLLNPKVYVFSSSLSLLGSASATGYGDTATVTFSASASTVYYIRAVANTGVTNPCSSGAYALQVNAGTGTLPTVSPPNTQVTSQPDGSGGTVNIKEVMGIASFSVKSSQDDGDAHDSAIGSLDFFDHHKKDNDQAIDELALALAS
jgi:hypothetical protein